MSAIFQMADIIRDQRRRDMLTDMREHHWHHDLNENSTYDEVMEEYQTMLIELANAEDAMYPNGRED